MGIPIGCKPIADGIMEAVRQKAARFEERVGRKPKLCIITVGEDEASEVYVRNKLRDCQACGIDAEHVKIADYQGANGELCYEIGEANRDDTVDGIIVQLPLPASIASYSPSYPAVASPRPPCGSANSSSPAAVPLPISIPDSPRGTASSSAWPSNSSPAGRSADSSACGASSAGSGARFASGGSCSRRRPSVPAGATASRGTAGRSAGGTESAPAGTEGNRALGAESEG